MKYIEIFKTVVLMLPALIDAIEAVEKVFPATGRGQEKLELLKDIIEKSYASGTQLTVSFEQLWPTLSGVISTVVGLFNKTGKFQKG